MSSPASGQALIDEPGPVLDEARSLAEELVPIRALTPADGYQLTQSMARFGLPLVYDDAAAAVDFTDASVLMRHWQQYSSLSDIVIIELEVTALRDPGLATRYVSERLRFPRATPIEFQDGVGLVVRPEEGFDDFRTVVAANGERLVTAVGRLGDGAMLSSDELEHELTQLVDAQLDLQGSGRWEERDAYLNGLVRQNGSRDTTAAIGAIASFSAALFSLVFFGRLFFSLRDREARRRWMRRLRFKADRQPASPDVVDVTAHGKRRRRAAVAFTLLRWFQAWVVLLVVAGFYVGLRRVSTQDWEVRPQNIVILAVLFATGWALTWLVKLGIRKYADSATRHLQRMDARPPGYGRIGARPSVGHIVVLVLTVFLLLLGILVTTLSSVALGMGDSDELYLDPLGEALGEMQVGLVLGLVIFALASTPTNWLRAKRNLGLSLAAGRDTRESVLLLRSFGDDGIKLNRQLTQQLTLVDRLRLSQRVGLEDVAVRRLWLHGPVLAIGEPGTNPPPLGATRVFFGDEWTTAIGQALQSSQLIAMNLGLTDGLAWELDRIVENQALNKTIFVVPPTEDAGVRIHRLCERARVVNPPPAGATPLVVTVDQDTRLATYFCASHRMEAAYTAALDQAIHEIKDWSPTNRTLGHDHQSPLATTAPVPGRSWKRNGRMTAQAGWLIALVSLLLPGVIDDAAAVVRSFPAASVGSFAVPGDAYASDSEEGRQAFVWGADYLWSPNRFLTNGIRPKAVDFDEGQQLVAVLDRTDDLILIDSETGAIAERIDLGIEGARSIAWHGSELLVTVPGEQQVVRIDERRRVSNIEVNFTPIYVESKGDRFVISAAQPAVFVGSSLEEPLQRVGLEHSANSMQPMGEGILINEAVRGRYLWLSTVDLRLSVVANRPGIAVATSTETFGIWDGRTFVQYTGPEPVPVRRTDVPDNQALSDSLLVFSDLDLLAFSGGSETGLAFRLCDGLICTIEETRAEGQ